MSLDGYNVSECGCAPQIVKDAFEAWVAAGMPLDSPLLDRSSPEKIAAFLSLIEDL
jgi:hypothetical protein